MEWLEIISVLAAGSKEKIKILELCGKISVPQSARLIVYGNNLSNELSIHIQWKSESATQAGRSPLGHELSRTAGDLGLVTHTLWQGCDQPKIPEDLPQVETAHPEGTPKGGKGVCEHLLCLLVRGRRTG